MGRSANDVNLELEAPQLIETQCWRGVYFLSNDGCGRMYCGRCYFNSRLPHNLSVKRFHAFAYGAFVPSQCAECRRPILLERPITQCSICLNKNVQLYREFLSVGLDTGSIGGIAFDSINDSMLQLYATDPLYQQLFPDTFHLIVRQHNNLRMFSSLSIGCKLFFYNLVICVTNYKYFSPLLVLSGPRG